MKKYLLLYAVAVTALLAIASSRYRTETRRLAQNQTALATQITHYGTRLGVEAASAQVLRLRCGEFETLRAADAEAIRSMGLKIRRLEASSRLVTATETRIDAPLHDTLIIKVRDSVVVRDSIRLFRWRDPWVSIEGRIGRDSVACRIRSTDTLRQVVHRIPHRFLFIRWGTKALRQEIVSTNPHTRIVHAEYIKIER